MGLLDRLTAPWRIASAQERHDELIGPNGPLGYYYAATTYGDRSVERIGTTFQDYARNGHGGNSIVWSLMAKRLRIFSEVELAWQRRSTGELFGDKRLRLLEEPWPNGSTGELLARMEQDVSLAGNAFIRNIDGVMLERLRPDCVTIAHGVFTDRVGREYKLPVGYFYSQVPGDLDDADFFEVDEVAHWSPIPDPLAQWRGMSWLTPVVREINSDSGLTDYKLKYLDHAATPNMILRYPEKVGADVLDRLEDKLHNRYGGLSQAYKTMVLDAGADLTLVGNSLEQMSFTTVQAAGENRIAAASEVPAVVSGLKEGLQSSTYSNTEQGLRAFADLWARPQWRSACSALSKLIPQPRGARLWYDASQVAALRQGEKERAETQNTNAETMAVLLRVGYTPESVTSAVKNGDLALLQHSGKLPVTLYPEGKDPASTPGGSSNDSEEAA